MIAVMVKSQTEFNALKEAVSVQLQVNDVGIQMSKLDTGADSGPDEDDETRKDIMEEALDPDYLNTFGYSDMDYEGENDDFD